MIEMLGAGVDVATQTSVSWQEIQAYSEALRLINEGWEKKTLRLLAEDYLRSVREAKNPLCIPPVERDVDE